MFFFTMGCKPHNPNRVEENQKTKGPSVVRLARLFGSRLLALRKKGETLLLGAQRENPADEGYEPNAG